MWAWLEGLVCLSLLSSSPSCTHPLTSRLHTPPLTHPLQPNNQNLTSSAFVVEFKDCFFVDAEIWIVMEFCLGGSVADMLDATQRTLSEPQIRAICACAAMGLAYLHENHKIHRDLKAGNILLSLDGKAKLADFGVSATLNNSMSKRKTVIGTPFWMAPEVIQEISYDGKADVWSLGVTAIEMAEGMPPHFNVHPMRAIFLIPSKPPPKLLEPVATTDGPRKWSADFHDFIAKCLVKDPTQRLDAAQLLSHPFLQADVEALRARPTQGLAPIKELVSSALEVLTKYRQSTVGTTPLVPLEEQFGKTENALPEDEEEEGGGGDMRPISLSVSASARAVQVATAREKEKQQQQQQLEEEEGGEGDAAAAGGVGGDVATLIRPAPGAGGGGGGGGGPLSNQRLSRSGQCYGEEGGAYDTLRRTSIVRGGAGAVPGLDDVGGGGGGLQHRKGRSSMDVSHSGTMVRHRPLSPLARKASSSAAGLVNGAGALKDASVDEMAETVKFTGMPKPEPTPGVLSALRYFTSAGKSSKEGGEERSEGAGGAAPPPTTYQDKKQMEAKARMGQELREKMEYMDRQYTAELAALKSAYAAEKKRLEDALLQL